jgi:hypothetical protein
MAQRSDLTAQTFLFADLSGFTALTEAHGDEQAADLVGGFCVAVRQLLTAHQTQEVKTILPGVAANEVKKGNPVGSIGFPFVVRIPLLAIHADPARIRPAGKLGESPALDQLAKVDLLYLGRANGTIVVYDATAHRTLYIPDSSVVLEIIDCPYDSIGRRPCKYGFLFR